MARPIRIQYPEAVYHVMARGNRGLKNFADDQDRKTFLAALEYRDLRQFGKIRA